MRHDTSNNPAIASMVIMLKSLKMHGMAQATLELAAQGSPAFEAAQPILSQLLNDPASFPRTPSHAANRLRSFVTGAMYPMAVCMRTRL